MRAAWVRVLRPHAVVLAPVAEFKARDPSGGVQVNNSLRSLGISIDSPLYSGEPGGCGTWWLQMQRSLSELHVAQELHFTVVRNQLRKEALTTLK